MQEDDSDTQRQDKEMRKRTNKPIIKRKQMKAESRKGKGRTRRGKSEERK
jgi:hypothetical protein